MKKLAVVVRQPQRHYEALRTSLGCLLEDHQVSYLVLDEEIHPDEAFSDNLGFLEEMEGRRYSNHPANVEKYGFTSMDLAAMGELLRHQDIIIPF
jgi:riboflavin synthase